MRARLLVLSALVLLAGCRLSVNLHEIHAGKLWRSAQLTGEELEQVIEEQGIKTILNLRGAHPDEDWYVAEREVAAREGVELVDIKMSAHHLPHREALLRLLDTFRDAPRPILVHCRAGADRTGEACAIYQMEYMGKTREQALRMLRLGYLHAAIFTPAKRYFMEQVWKGEVWAREAYDPRAPDQVYEYYEREDEGETSVE